MRNTRSGLIVCCLLVPGVFWSVRGWANADEPSTPLDLATDTTAFDRALLSNLGLGSDGPALLDYFRKRTYPETNPKETARLIDQLGNEDFEIRDKAHVRLLDIGAGALAGIKQAEKNKDPEVNRRAHELLQRIEANAEPGVQAATARLIAKLKPTGAAEVLLNYLPFAADQQVSDEICKSLGAVAVVAGKVEPCVLQAMADKLPVKRGAAGEACARARATDQLPAVRKLLADPDPAVRLRVALALVPYKEKEIVPVLVDVLGYLSPERLWPAEEILVNLAGDHCPSVSLGTTEATRKSCRAAWQAWLDKEGGSLNLARLGETRAMLGYTLVVQQMSNKIAGGRRPPAMGEIIELDTARPPKVRWKFDVPTYPVDAQIVKVDGAERVLVAEYQGSRVSERDFKGTIKWEKNVGGSPLGVQRLPTGNTFVVMQNRLLEIDRQGNEAFALTRPNHDILRARKLRSGDVVIVTNNGTCLRIDGKSQKVQKTFHVGQMVLFGSIDVLADGGLLIPDFQQNRVVEFNADGRQIKTFTVQWPNSVMRLPNGHTLVGSQNTSRLAEFDRAGREVWSHTLEGMPLNARRR
jgi:hypothetical protein